MLRRLGIYGFALVLLATLLSPSEATARKLILITHGETISHVGEVESSLLKQAIRKETGKDPAVGFMYSYFGIFWVDLWTWGGEYCLYQDKTVFMTLTPEQAAFFMNKSESDVGKPFIYRFPLGLLILVGIVGVAVPVKLFRKRPEDKLKKLFEDPRYQKALNIFSEQSAKQQTAGNAMPAEQPSQEPVEKEPEMNAAFDAAVLHLTSEGITREEAEQNLALMLHTLQQHYAAQNEQAPASPS